MSLSKKLCLRCDSQNRQSFIDRFSDNMCEEILQFLPLKDKLRLQCVSKQFQRTVFKGQYELYINIWCRAHHKSFLENKMSRKIYHNYYYIEDERMDSFKTLLKKCPNITSISLNWDFCWFDVSKIVALNAVFRQIIENCNNLSEFIVLNDIELHISILDEFHQKFGQSIKYLRFDGNFNRRLIELNRFPNIEKIYIDCDIHNQSIIPQLKLDKLKKLKIALGRCEEHMLKTVIDNFPTLTHLDVYVSSDKVENSYFKSLKNISNLKHLIHFKLEIQCMDSNKRFCRLLKQMANNCKMLKSIDCLFNISEENSDIRQLLSKLKAFPALKRLNLRLTTNSLWIRRVLLKQSVFPNDESSDTSSSEDYVTFSSDSSEDRMSTGQDMNIDQYFSLFSFKLFKGFSNITHLKLCFGWKRLTLKESKLKDIDINLPNLRYLEIKYPFDTTPLGMTQMADILSRLSRLETLKLKFKSGVDLKPIEEQITEKCRKIKEIKIESDSDSDSESD